jgi:hypothetical protein
MLALALAAVFGVELLFPPPHAIANGAAAAAASVASSQAFAFRFSFMSLGASPGLPFLAVNRVGAATIPHPSPA